MIDVREAALNLALRGDVVVYGWANESTGKLIDTHLYLPAGDVRGESAEDMSQRDLGHADDLSARFGTEVTFLGRLSLEQIEAFKGEL